MSCLNQIDWKLFKQQKEVLVELTENYKTNTREVEALIGIINMMDAIQDERMPKELT